MPGSLCRGYPVHVSVGVGGCKDPESSVDQIPGVGCRLWPDGFLFLPVQQTDFQTVCLLVALVGRGENLLRLGVRGC